MAAEQMPGGWVRWWCDFPSCSEHVDFETRLGGEAPEGWWLDTSVREGDRPAIGGGHHYCPKHAAAIKDR
jgi:hypothetical protein